VKSQIEGLNPMARKTKIVARKAKPLRSKRSGALTVLPATAVAAEHPGWAMMHDMHAMMTAVQAKMDVMQAQHHAERVPIPATMVDAANMLTVKQGCRVLSDMDDGRLYNRPHLIHLIAGTCYVDNDEIRAEFPDRHNQARFLEIVERNKPRTGHPAYIEKAQEAQTDESEPPPLSHLTGNDKAG